jgi:excisionase family DNA binding protein
MDFLFFIFEVKLIKNKQMEKKQNDKQLFSLYIREFGEIIRRVFQEKQQQLPEKKEVLKKELVTLKEITQMFKISKPTVYKWVRMNLLPQSKKIGGRVYFYKSEIDKLLLKENDNS